MYIGREMHRDLNVPSRSCIEAILTEGQNQFGHLPKEKQRRSKVFP
jgi:hypothetical protein